MKPPETTHPDLPRKLAPIGLAALAARCGGELPLPAGCKDSAVFAEPWQAHAFALTLQLHERGLFEWTDWAAALSREIRTAQAGGDADDGSTYYRHWLNALETIVIDRQIGTHEQLHRLEHAWEAAAKRTPHGQPIVLEPASARRS